MSTSVHADIFAWGALPNGQSDTWTPTVVKGVSGVGIRQVSASENMLCITGGFRIIGWGTNAQGQLGDRKRSTEPFLIRRVAKLRIIQVSCFGSNTIFTVPGCMW